MGLKRKDTGHWFKANQEQTWRAEAEIAARKPCYDSFEEYVADYPDAERYRTWIGNGILLPTYPGPNMPGDYYTATVRSWPIDGVTEFWVVLHDVDDGMCRKQVASMEEGRAALEELKQLAPFYYWDLEDWGYTDFN